MESLYHIYALRARCRAVAGAHTRTAYNWSMPKPDKEDRPSPKRWI
jgi:hypothetical protein